MKRLGATSLAIGLLLATGAQAQDMSDCTYWRADPYVREATDIRFLGAATLLFDSGRLRVQAVRDGRPARGAQMVRLRGADGRFLREVTVITSPVESLREQVEALRLPVGVSVVAEEDDGDLGFAEFILLEPFKRDGGRIVPAGGNAAPRGYCRDQPDARTLLTVTEPGRFDAGPAVGADAGGGDKGYSYPGGGGGSLRDLAKGGAGGAADGGPSLLGFRGGAAEGGGGGGDALSGSPSLRELAGGGATPPVGGGGAEPPPVAVTELAPADAVPVADPAPAGLAVCVPGLAAPVRSTLSISPGATYLAGFRNATLAAPAVTYSTLLDAAIPAEGQLLLTAVPGALDLVEVFKSGTDAAGKPEVLLRPLGARIAAAVDPAPEPDAAPEAGPAHALVVRLFGEPERVAISGLGLIDPAIADLRRSAGLRILWHDIGPDGAIAPPQTYESFTALVDAARAREGWDVNYSLASGLQRFADGVVSTLETSPERTDLSIWVLEGVLLPDESPQILSEMIRRVGASGNIPRFESDNAPRRWLYVLSGQFAQSFSEGYLRGPIQRSRPAIGEIDIEIRGAGEERSLMTDPARPAHALRSQFSRLGIAPVEAPAAAAPLPPEDGDSRPAMAGEQGYSDLGLVMDAAALDGFLSDLAGTMRGFRAFTAGEKRDGSIRVARDATALFRPRSDETGRIQHFEVDMTIEGAGMQRKFDGLKQRGQGAEFDGFLQRLTIAAAELRHQVSADGCGLVYVPLVDLGTPAE